MSGISAVVDDRELARRLARASRVLGKDVGTLLKFYSAPAMMDLMKTFPPMLSVSGKDAFGQQRRLGNAAVERDIGKVYVGLGTVVEEVKRATAEDDAGAARGFAKMVRQGRVAEARELLRRVGLAKYAGLEMGRFDAGHHAGSRNRLGRVSRRRQAQVVVDVASLKRYIRERKQRLGILKSGWLAGYRAAGGKGSVPRWISEHGRTGRSIDGTRVTRNPVFTVINGVDYASAQNRTGGGLARLVLARSRKKMLRGLDGAVRRALRRV